MEFYGDIEYNYAMMVNLLNLPRAPGDTRTDEERAAVAERFSDDPSRGLIAFNPDGSFDWPSSWSFDRKVRAIDFARRGGDPNKPAAPLGEGDLVDRMVEKLHAECGNRIDIDAEIETMKRKNDAEIENFLEWKSSRRAMFEAKIASLVETPLFVTAYCTQPLHLKFLANLAEVGFPAGTGGGQVTTEPFSMVSA